MGTEPLRGPPARAFMLVLLRKVPLFAAWPDVAREAVCKVSRLNIYQPGDIIARRGEVGGGLRVVADGRLESSRTWANGRRFVQGFLTSGQTTDLADAFGDQPTLYDTIARTRATVLILPRAGLDEAMNRHPAVACAVIQALCGRLNEQAQRLQTNSAQPLGPRLVRTLLDLSRDEAGEGAATRDVGVAQDDLAAMLGLSRQSVAKALKPLIEAGLVETRYRGVRLLDPARLVAMATEDPPEAPPFPPSPP